MIPACIQQIRHEVFGVEREVEEGGSRRGGSGPHRGSTEAIVHARRRRMIEPPIDVGPIPDRSPVGDLHFLLELRGV